jgi:hypothetical protein
MVSVDPSTFGYPIHCARDNGTPEEALGIMLVV